MTTNQTTDVEKIEDLKIKTLNAIFRGQKDKVQKLYGKVESLYIKGSDLTRILIANKFIFPISQLLEIKYSQGSEFLNGFPSQLKTEYYRQINSSGI
jgi:hypothetical protein